MTQNKFSIIIGTYLCPTFIIYVNNAAGYAGLNTNKANVAKVTFINAEAFFLSLKQCVYLSVLIRKKNRKSLLESFDYAPPLERCS